MEQIPQHCPGTESEQAGKASACEGCPNQNLCQTAAVMVPDPEMMVKENIKSCLLVLSGKGGVGKSTFASQLALGLAHLHPSKTIGLLDVDICGPSVPRMVDAESERLFVSGSGWEPVWVRENCAVVSAGLMLENPEEAIIWRGSKKNELIKQFFINVNWNEVDLLVVDTPPGTTDEHLALAKYLKPCFEESSGLGVLVVTTPHALSIQDVRRQLEFCRKVGLKVWGIIENMAGFTCPKCQVKTLVFKPDKEEGGAEQLAKDFDVPFLGQIPLDPRVGYCSDHGLSMLETYPETRTSIALTELTNRLTQMIVSMASSC